MFPMRIATLFSEADVDGAGTTIVDLDLTEVISRILIKFKAYNGDNGQDDVPFANITKIEIVDGSDVLFTFNGQAADAVNFYDLKRPEVSSWSFLSEYANESYIGLNFGLFDGDPVNALDPNRFRNLQLKITHDEDIANTSTDVNRLKVTASVFSGLSASPIGFFQVKEQYAYTPTAGAYEEIELPTDLPIRTLYLQALDHSQWFGNSVDEIRLDEDALKTIFFDDKYYEVMKMYRPLFGKYVHKSLLQVETTATAHYRAPTADAVTLGMPFGATEYFLASSVQFGALLSSIADTQTDVIFQHSGYLPHYVGAVPFGQRNVPETWYNPVGVKKLRLRIKGGASLGGAETFRIITQQLRRY